jgi:hypothetical protein
MIWRSLLGVVAVLGCRPTREPVPTVETVPILPAAPRPSRSCATAPDLHLLAVRRPPAAISTDGSDVYWIDAGHFEAAGYVRDGALWRMPAAGGTATRVVEDLGVASDLAVTATTIFVAIDSATGGGVRAIAKLDGRTRWLWLGGPVSRLAVQGDALHAIVDRPGGDQLYRIQQADGAATLVDPDVGAAETVARVGDGIAVGGARSSEVGASGSIVMSHPARRLAIEPVVTGLAADEHQLYLAAGSQLIELPHGGTHATVRATAPDAIASVVSDANGLSWLATRPGGFEIIVAGHDADIRTVDRSQIGWRHLVDSSRIYWVESDPVTVPWKHEPTPYRIGWVSRWGCR